MRNVLVLGGYGAVGVHLVAELRATGVNVIAAGRDAARADLVMDLTDPGLEAYTAALSGTDVVVNASGAENPRLAALAGAHGVAFVDVTATTDYVAELERLTPAAAVIVNVGLAPGLTNLLAAAVHRVSPGPIDLAVLLGVGEQHGAAATEWTYHLLGKRFHDGTQVTRNFTRPKTFDLPGEGRRRLYRVDFSDQRALCRDLGVQVRTYFGVDSTIATRALATLTWIPGASRAPRGLHLPGTEDWLVLARGHNGATRWARGRAQSRATAVVAVIAVRAAAHLPPGIHHLHQVLDINDVPPLRGIDLASSGCSAG
ncbi:hypothetical protein OHA40_04070 [Nocardia sp. NBC_00508]|uniref:NAD-dependent epimerase/dehydratase family protein n=1 Tax=Nocardia sp. NBC_00508 TaxID=2975992 RepID=UPI002E80D44E|nr:NAD-dependent epimerase/dehydratase family protein [Nocardia sp. NBC_00508]WUD67339.1 hypothetical protein OHA40_04070 [Nocardia sp. NBC_00508]